MKLENKMLVCLMAVLAVASVGAAQQSSAYSLSFFFSADGLELANVSLVEAPASAVTDVDGYLLRLLSFRQQVLFEKRFFVSLEIEEQANPSWFDENGTQIFIPQAPAPLENTSIAVSMPYSPNGKSIEVYDPNETFLFAIDVSHFAQCNEDFNCEGPRENHDICPSDCLSGVSDGLCDSMFDVVCDPDCGASQDIDCQDPTLGPENLEPILADYTAERNERQLILINETDAVVQRNLAAQLDELDARIRRIGGLQASIGIASATANMLVGIFFAAALIVALLLIYQPWRRR